MEKRKKLTKKPANTLGAQSPLRTSHVPVKPRPVQATPEKSDSQAKAVRKLTTPKKYLILSSVCVVIVIFGSILVPRLSTSDGVKKPDYKTVLPANTPVSELGGWKRVSPPNKAPVFAYTDTIDNITISVSQQPLPESFKGDVDSKTAELAKKFSATTKLDADDTTVYVGTSSKGPQSVILSKNNLLILIKSEKKISNESWISYVKNLR